MENIKLALTICLMFILLLGVSYAQSPVEKSVEQAIIELNKRGYYEDADRISRLKDNGHISFVDKEWYNYDNSVEILKKDSSTGVTTDLVIYSDFEKESLDKKLLALKSTKTVGDMVNDASKYLKSNGFALEAEELSRLNSNKKILEKGTVDLLMDDGFGRTSIFSGVIKVNAELKHLPVDMQAILLLHENFRLNQTGYYLDPYKSEQDVYGNSWKNFLKLIGENTIKQMCLKPYFTADGTSFVNADADRVYYFMNLIGCAANWGCSFVNEKLSQNSDVTWYSIFKLYEKLASAWELYKKEQSNENLVAYQQALQNYSQTVQSIQPPTSTPANGEATSIMNSIKQDVSSSFRLISITTHDKYSFSYEFERGEEPNVEKLSYFYYKPKGAKYASLTRKFGSQETLLSQNISKISMDNNSSGNLNVSLVITKDNPDGSVASSCFLSEELQQGQPSSISTLLESAPKVKPGRIKDTSNKVAAKKPLAVTKTKKPNNLKKLQEQMAIAYRKYTSLVSAGKSDSAEAKKALDEYRKLQSEINKLSSTR